MGNYSVPETIRKLKPKTAIMCIPIHLSKYWLKTGRETNAVKPKLSWVNVLAP